MAGAARSSRGGPLYRFNFRRHRPYRASVAGSRQTTCGAIRGKPMKFTGLLAAFALAAAAAPAMAQVPVPHPGQPVYRTFCASCHDRPDETRAPTKATLSAMSVQALTYTLTQGKMKAQAAGMSDENRADLLNYLTGKSAVTVDAWSKAMACDARRRDADITGAATVSTFGFDARNTRVLSAAQTGLSKAKLSNLELAWSLGFPDVTMMRSQGAVVGNTVFLPVAEAAALYAFDVSVPAKPCVKWIYNTPGGAPLRTSAGYGVITAAGYKSGRKVVVVAGLDSTVHLIDARTGKAVWTKNVASYSFSMTTATPRVLKDRIIVPVSQYEIMQAADNRVDCCTNHGFVLSLDPLTGAQQWRYDTMEDAKPIRDRGDGKPLKGPSGAPIWNSPIVDEARGLIYFGTGESNSPPAHRNTDALIALRLADGKEAWSMQATTRDIYNAGCGPTPKPTQLNCVTDTVYRDVDFGASLILGKLKDGRELLFAGQKSGTLWALEPATGKVVWRRDIGTGAANGGIHWGIAFHDDTLFVPIAVVGRDIPGQKVDPDLKPGLYAVNAATGSLKWNFATASDCANGRDKRSPRCDRFYGLSAAPTVIDGTVIAGSLDGWLRVFDEKTGAELWKFDTATTYDTLNGVKAHGGSIDTASIVGVNGLLLVNSGYGMFGQAPGNVMLAFKPKAGR
jgi:polyvinyl alcohol dehydrogenase (cytochrome)